MCASRAAQFLGIDRETLRRWINHGDGPPRVRKGKRFYYVREVLREWLKGNAQTAAPPPPRPSSAVPRASLNGHNGANHGRS
jgi:predicted site-specific integrase-resolvase